MKELIWEPATVGCYWNAGDFHIMTYRNNYAVPNSGYLLTCRFEELGRYPTLEDAQNAAHGLAV